MQDTYDGALTPEIARELLDALRNISHDDLDDEYAGPCPECGGKQIYDRRVPSANRPIMCINPACKDYCGDDAIPELK